MTLALASPKKEGLDLNRNFPSEWRQEGEQPGAGPFPGSEPEVYNLVKFIASHPNITGGISFHTQGGVLAASLRDEGRRGVPRRRLMDLSGHRQARHGDHRLSRTSACFTSSSIIRRKSSRASSTTGCTTISASSRGRWRFGLRSDRPESRTTNTSIGTASIPSKTISRCLLGRTRSWRAKAMSPGTPFEHPQLGSDRNWRVGRTVRVPQSAAAVLWNARLRRWPTGRSIHALLLPPQLTLVERRGAQTRRRRVSHSPRGG